MQISNRLKLAIRNIILLILFIFNCWLYVCKHNLTPTNSVLILAPLIILLLVAIIQSVNQSMTLLGFIYLAAALFTAFLGEQDNATATIFMIFTLKVFSNKISVIIILISISMVYLFKFIVNNYDLYNISNIVVFNVGAYGIDKYLNIIIHEGDKNGDRKSL